MSERPQSSFITVEFKGKNTRKVEVKVSSEAEFKTAIETQGLEFTVKGDDFEFSFVASIDLTVSNSSLRVLFHKVPDSLPAGKNYVMETADPTFLNFHDKQVEDAFTGYGLSTVFQSIFYTYLRILKYERVRGVINPRLAKSKSSLFSTRDIFSGKVFYIEEPSDYVYITHLNRFA